MTNYVLDGHDLSALFDFSKSPIPFSEDPRRHIPNSGSIIYSVWDKDEKFIYIGISGLQKTLEKRSPLSRMISHASIRRSGDQFCIYIHDFYLVPELIVPNSQIQITIEPPSLDGFFDCSAYPHEDTSEVSCGCIHSH